MFKRIAVSFATVLITCSLAFVGESEAQKYGGTLNLGMYADLHTPDLHRTIGNPTSQMGMLMAESLIAYNAKCEMIPSLAKSWDVSPDAKVYSFQLRKGVKFHNGREMTAVDVKKNYDHFMDKKTRSPRRGNFRTIKLIEVVDKYTVRFHLSKPDAGFLVKIRPTIAFILAPESFETKPPHPIATGPFQFVEWKPGQYVKLKKNKNYWKKDSKGNQLPFVDEIIMRPIIDATVRYTALRTGNVDWVWTLPFEQVPAIQKNPPKGITADIRGGARWFYLTLNFKKGPTKDIRVRQAIALALDKQALMDGITWGLASAETQPYFPGSKWYVKGFKDRYAKADVAKARQLLKEAGYPNGVTLNTIVRNESVIMNLATLAQAQLKKAGIKLKFEVMDRAAHRKRQSKSQFDVSPGHLTFVPDPDALYYRFFQSEQRNNYGRYDNPEYDKIVTAANQILDFKKRKAMYLEALILLNRDLPTLFLGHLPIAQARRDYVKGLTTNCRGDTNHGDGGLSYAWIDK